jgi:hypothetical protein
METTPLTASRLALAAALVGASALSAFPHPVQGAGACDGITATVVLNSDAGKVVHRDGHTWSYLKRIQKRHSSKNTKRGWYPLGLTQAELRINLRLGVRVIPVSAKRFCAAPESVEVTAGFTTFVIYIDRKYRRGGAPTGPSLTTKTSTWPSTARRSGATPPGSKKPGPRGQALSPRHRREPGAGGGPGKEAVDEKAPAAGEENGDQRRTGQRQNRYDLQLPRHPGQMPEMVRGGLKGF